MTQLSDTRPLSSSDAQPPPEAHDPNVVSPVTGAVLVEGPEGALVSPDGTESFRIEDGILLTFVDEAAQPDETEARDDVTHTVQQFYEDAPFPNYNDFDTLQTFLARAQAGVFARLLSAQIPINASVLEIGCGTGQLCNFLAATCMSEVYGTDMTLASLRLGREFADRNRIDGIKFLQMNLFRPSIRRESMDVVIANGVLHHTYDTRKAFMSVARLVKPGGHLLVGLYNRIGRIRTDIRRGLYRVLGEPALRLDPYLRTQLSDEKRRAWIKDQYLHPQERKHTMSEVLDWFDQAGFAFVSSIPRIRGGFSQHERLFQPQDAGTSMDRVLAETGMIFSHGHEGGLFIMIGRKG